jgi:hypothetical protein
MTTPDYTARDTFAAEDRAEAATKARRGYMQIRSTFVQTVSGADRSGPLAVFVSGSQYRAILVYLMLLNVWPWLHDDKLPMEAAGWINLLHSRGTPGRTLVWSESTLSRTWKYLAKTKMITKNRGALGRLRVVPSMEDGSGNPYTFPTGEKGNLEEAYFTLPERFWSEEDFAALTLPGIAMLLILARETNKKPEFSATQDQMADWFGIHRSTVAKGLEQLRVRGLLNERFEEVPAKLSKIRKTWRTHFSLTGEYVFWNSWIPHTPDPAPARRCCR